MPSDTPISPPLPDDRRAYYRITVVLPVSIQAGTDHAEGTLIERSVNISGGGIGVTVSERHDPGEVLSLTLLFPDGVNFTAAVEVVRVDTIATSRALSYRLHARFVRMAAQDRELLIRYIMRFQRDHLQRHYSA